MNEEMFLEGEYVSGIAKRPDLVGQPCVLAFGGDGLILRFLSGDNEEKFEFPYTSIDKIKTNTRLLVSEDMGVGGKMISNAENFLHKSTFSTFVKGSKRRTYEAYNNTIGKMHYRKRQELIVEYRQDNINRMLFIYVDCNPKEFINYFNGIKK